MEVSDDDYNIYELFNGQLTSSQRPSGLHQLVLSRLMLAFWVHVEKHNLGFIFGKLTTVVLSNLDVPLPDLIFVSKENYHKFDKVVGINGAPDLVVEILSPTSVNRDKNQKMKLYEKHGISEYWIVYPEYKFIEIYNLENGKYTLSQSGDNGDSIKSKIIKDFELKVESIFTTP